MIEITKTTLEVAQKANSLIETATLKPCIAELERFYAFLNEKHSLKLPNKAVITIQTKGRSQALGHFAKDIWHNGEDTPIHEINISAEHLNENPYETLAHEIAHFCELLEKKSLSRNNYHDRVFKKYAEQLGLAVSKLNNYGFAFTSPTAEFNRVLELEFKPQREVFKLIRAKTNRKKQPTKMLKWSCNCTIIRCATELNAVCNNCNTQFIREV